MSVKKEYLSFRDFIPQITLTKKNDTVVHLTEYVRNRLRVYKDKNNLRSDSHAVHSLIVENEMLRTIMTKIDTAIKKAKIEGNVDYFRVAFEDQASNKERAFFDLIWRGALY